MAVAQTHVQYVRGWLSIDDPYRTAHAPWTGQGVYIVPGLETLSLRAVSPPSVIYDGINIVIVHKQMIIKINSPTVPAHAVKDCATGSIILIKAYR